MGTSCPSLLIADLVEVLIQEPLRSRPELGKNRHRYIPRRWKDDRSPDDMRCGLRLLLVLHSWKDCRAQLAEGLRELMLACNDP